MQIKTITYGFTKSLGNYQSSRLEVTAELEQGEDPIAVADVLKEFVHTQLNKPTEQKLSELPFG